MEGGPVAVHGRPIRGLKSGKILIICVFLEALGVSSDARSKSDGANLATEVSKSGTGISGIGVWKSGRFRPLRITDTLQFVKLYHAARWAIG